MISIHALGNCSYTWGIPTCLLHLTNMLQDLEFSISWHKMIKPTQKLVFLGVELDTQYCQLTLPQQKLTGLQSLVTSFLSKCRANKKQLQQLARKSNWACCVVYGSHTFLRRILDMMNFLQSPSAKARFSADFMRTCDGGIPFCKFSMANAPLISSLAAHYWRVHWFLPLCCWHGAFFWGDWLYHHFQCDPQCLQISIWTTRRFLPKSSQHFGGVIHVPTSIL